MADSNRAAVQWIDGWRRWPSPAFIVYGPAGSGKSHLVQVFLQLAAARKLTSTDFEVHALASIDPSATYAVDDVDQIEKETALLHLYNTLVGAGGKILLTARHPVRDWGVSLPDLLSRLRAAPGAEIGAPDDQLMEAVLGKLFSDRQLRVEANVIRYLLLRMERSLAAAGVLVEAIDSASLSANRRVTLPLVRDVLANFSATRKFLGTTEGVSRS